jgi:hypothetical protein
VPALPALAISLLSRIDRHRRAGLGRYYERALDFYFWAGVRAASRVAWPLPQSLAARPIDELPNAADDPPPMRVG